MKCDTAMNLMSAYIDKDLNEIDRLEFEKHISECSKCKEEYDILVDIVSHCNTCLESELPDGFSEELHLKLQNIKRPVRRFNIKWVAGIVAAFLVVAIGFGSGAFNNSIMDQSVKTEEIANESQVASMPASAPDIAYANGASKDQMKVTFSENRAGQEGFGGAMGMTMEKSKLSNRKVIKNGYLSLEVSDFDLALNEITRITSESGGFVENSQVDNINYTMDGQNKSRKNGNITIRIPANGFEGIFETIKSMGDVKNENKSGEDITREYRDIETRAENLKVQESSLRELMTKAKTVDEILRIETELNRVRTDIDIMTGGLRRWDDLVDLSTLNINLIEVKKEDLKKISVDNVWGKAYRGFINAINNVIGFIEASFVFFVTAIPYIIIIGLIGFIAFKVIKKNKKGGKINAS